MRAMIIDDSRAIRMMLSRALATCGFDEFVEAGDGQEALEVLATINPPDVAFVDWNMPIMMGIDFVRAVRRDTDFDTMAIVMVTSETSFDNVEAALEAGADEYVMKPFTAEMLEEKLAIVNAARS